MNVYILLAAAIWWTLAVVLWVQLIHDWGRDTKDRAIAIGLAVFWPAVAIGVIPALIYLAYVASADKIRTDLRNRKLLGEFEDWLRQRAVED
jgi:hypothetical protein